MATLSHREVSLACTRAPPASVRLNAAMAALLRMLRAAIGASPDSGGAGATAPVAELGAPGARGARALSELCAQLTAAPVGSEAAAAAAHEALAAGALPALAAVVRQAAGDATAPEGTCMSACVALAAALRRAECARARAALTSAPGVVDAVAKALEARGAASAELALRACEALSACCEHGSPPSGAAAAAAGHGVAAALKTHATQAPTAASAASAACVLVSKVGAAAADAFFDARGLEALYAATEAQLDNHDVLADLLDALVALQRAAPCELLVRFRDDENRSQEAFGVLAGVLQRRASLPAGALDCCVTAASGLASAAAGGKVACLRMARTGVLDGATACLLQFKAPPHDDVGAPAAAVRSLRLACVRLLRFAASHGATPADVASALHALAGEAATSGTECAASARIAIQYLVSIPGVLDVALEAKVPETLVATQAACGGAQGCVCAPGSAPLTHLPKAAAPTRCAQRSAPAARARWRERCKRTRTTRRSLHAECS